VRSSVPIPGNPWPHDMVITVDDDPVSLVELLWVRDAWGLQPLHDDVPPPLVDSPEPQITADNEVGRASPSSSHTAGVSEPDCALTLQLSDEADYPQPMSDSGEHVVWLAAGPVKTRCAGQRRAKR